MGHRPLSVLFGEKTRYNTFLNSVELLKAPMPDKTSIQLFFSASNCTNWRLANRPFPDKHVNITFSQSARNYCAINASLLHEINSKNHTIIKKASNGQKFGMSLLICLQHLNIDSKCL